MDSERDTSSAEIPGRGWPLLRAKFGLAGWALVGIGLLSQAGCMSALTATTLREALRETAASLSSPHDLDHASMSHVDPGVAASDEHDEPSDPAEDVELDQVIDNAVARLSAAGGIDAPTQELLIKTLEQTRPEDWAVVVNEFAATLEATRGSAAATDGDEGMTTARPSTGGVIELDIPAPVRPPQMPPADVAVPPQARPAVAADLPAREPAVEVLPVAPVTIAPLSVAAVAAAAPQPSAPQPVTPPPQPIDVVDLQARPIAAADPEPVAVAALIEPEGTPAASSEVPSEVTAAEPVAPTSPTPMPPTPESFEPPATVVEAVATPSGPAVNNACFATRVRGWGNVERFPSTTFRPGQEVIVYFELDRLKIRSAADGHTTGIDSSFRLVDAAGQRVGQWSFDPIVETCPSPRRDYFVRYFLRIPEDAKPGRHRLEWSVTDTVATATRDAHLDLEIAAD
jgi:hypothetical protein